MGPGQWLTFGMLPLRFSEARHACELFSHQFSQMPKIGGHQTQPQPQAQPTPRPASMTSSSAGHRLLAKRNGESDVVTQASIATEPTQPMEIEDDLMDDVADDEAAILELGKEYGISDDATDMDYLRRCRKATVDYSPPRPKEAPLLTARPGTKAYKKAAGERHKRFTKLTSRLVTASGSTTIAGKAAAAAEQEAPAATVEAARPGAAAFAFVAELAAAAAAAKVDAAAMAKAEEEAKAAKAKADEAAAAAKAKAAEEAAEAEAAEIVPSQLCARYHLLHGTVQEFLNCVQEYVDDALQVQQAAQTQAALAMSLVAAEFEMQSADDAIASARDEVTAARRRAGSAEVLGAPMPFGDVNASHHAPDPGDCRRDCPCGTLLHAAAAAGDLERVSLLLLAKADVNLSAMCSYPFFPDRGPRGEVPEGCCSLWPDCYIWPMEVGERGGMCLALGCTRWPMPECRQGCPAIPVGPLPELLCDRLLNVPPLVVASAAGHTTIVDLLLTSQADPNPPSLISPLHAVCLAGPSIVPPGYIQRMSIIRGHGQVGNYDKVRLVTSGVMDETDYTAVALLLCRWGADMEATAALVGPSWRDKGLHYWAGDMAETRDRLLTEALTPLELARWRAESMKESSMCQPFIPMMSGNGNLNSRIGHLIQFLEAAMRDMGFEVQYSVQDEDDALHEWQLPER